MNFNKERFANFATYDLTINKSFYRNMAIVTHLHRTDRFLRTLLVVRINIGWWNERSSIRLYARSRLL